MSLATALKAKNLTPQKKRTESLWKGPEKDGITFSMLSRFLVCRERFRIAVVEGLRTADTFNHRIEYGQMHHACEEALAAKKDWQPRLLAYREGLHNKYPLQYEQIEHWYEVCKVQFPLYVAYWSKQKDVKDRTPLFQEQVFDVPYVLPSGRTVRLRGKWDSVDLIGRGKAAGIYLQENKTKGDINEQQLRRQLTFDLQTMLYLVALYRYVADTGALDRPVLGVRYNVVRRPLSGGKGTIVRHKATKSKPAETYDDYYQRLSGIIEGSPGEFFMRWKCEISPEEVAKFRRECLDPILEQLCDWWGCIAYCSRYNLDPFTMAYKDQDAFEKWFGIHHRHPFGVFNVLDEGGSSDLDEYLATGSRVGLRQVDRLFTELT